ncbi:MAG: DUF3540 domain-containing protein [Rouxiella aceris]|uniref:DUF3540 domain-containing protein n=1 Tax=Rouxiella aceris TaxID=2703884 RepID=UPI00284B5582|nr:DUF3540 domain-containing protein [Rouxiella aceris]MDR3434556.1 DUF3540 domain-containing protein [Rouxiella aceris]
MSEEVISTCSSASRRRYLDASTTLPAGSPVIADVKIDAAGNYYLFPWPDHALKTAVSCLISPQEGDRVRAIFDRQTLIITDILARKSAGPRVINSQDHDLHLVAPNISLQGKEGVTVQAENISLLSATSRWLAERMEQVSRRLFVRADDAHRQIKHTDNLQAENIHHQAAQTLIIKGRLASVKGAAVLKVDGNQIHMG